MYLVRYVGVYYRIVASKYYPNPGAKIPDAEPGFMFFSSLLSSTRFDNNFITIHHHPMDSLTPHLPHIP